MTLESFLEEGLDGEPRGFGSTFRRAIAALAKAKIEFAVAGSIAYSVQVEPTNTRDVDLLVDPRESRRAWFALEKAGFAMSGGDYLVKATDEKTGVWIDLMFGVADPEESARVDARRKTLFRVVVPVITPEYMLWMYLLSDQGKHRDRAIEMLRRGQINTIWLKWALKHDNDEGALRLLLEYIEEAKRPATQWSPRRPKK